MKTQQLPKVGDVIQVTVFRTPNPAWKYGSIEPRFFGGYEDLRVTEVVRWGDNSIDVRGTLVDTNESFTQQWLPPHGDLCY